MRSQKIQFQYIYFPYCLGAIEWFIYLPIMVPGMNLKTGLFMMVVRE